MAVTLDGIDIETITRINELQRPLINNASLGVHSLVFSQHLKSTLQQFDISGIWSAGDTDYDNKIRKIQNIVDSGLPVWLIATDWRKNKWIFGKVSEFATREDEGQPSVDIFSFIMTAVASIGYSFIVDVGAGNFKIYDVDKKVQSDTLNPILRRCNFTKSSTQVTYSFFVKNISVTNATVKIEIMVPDEVNSGNVGSKVTASGWTLAAGTVGTSGFSSSPGTKQRATISKAINAGVEEQVNITLTFTSDEASYLDGSIDENAA